MALRRGWRGDTPWLEFDTEAEADQVMRDHRLVGEIRKLTFEHGGRMCTCTWSEQCIGCAAEVVLKAAAQTDGAGEGE